MSAVKKLEEINQNRRRFFGAAAVTIAASQLGMLGSVEAQASEAQTAGGTAGKAAGNTSFGPLKQIDAGLLNVGYAEAGPAGGPAVILLHGWPYDIHSFVDVAPLLASKGYRVIVPYLRGYGTTKFLSSTTVRNGEQAAVALDIIALMDALEIKRAIIAGFDWGARTAAVMASSMARSVQSAGLRQRVSHRQPESGAGAAASSRGARILVRMLFRARTTAVPGMPNTRTTSTR